MYYCSITGILKWEYVMTPSVRVPTSRITGNYLNPSLQAGFSSVVRFSTRVGKSSPDLAADSGVSIDIVSSCSSVSAEKEMVI